MKITNKVDINLEYIRKGNTGCVFASALSKYPEKVGWVRQFNPTHLSIPKNAHIFSMIFEGKDKEWVREWALDNGMYLESTSKNTTGLRYKSKYGISWVQYFGPDSHAKTRQTPVPELLFCVRLPVDFYSKVGFKGILHLAHASISNLVKSKLDFMWNRSFIRVKEILGHKPTINEAAKTTFKNS